MLRMSRSLKVRPECLENVRLALKRNGFSSQKSFSEELGLALATFSKFFHWKSCRLFQFSQNLPEIKSRLASDRRVR
ncbi:hypothetical protein [Dendronalium sp. ChiSLP03b]|uniref:hypothetical protein n=1 Tax=Dendronalium sp. ChiSLP03b TaxID=3075381 RepID=UPI002AD2D533|nr:hypothetical protein [Dendronalium sp. ChiSLP03b]MDZ8204159.1 hypothetical protein [Dendronalium sp. ChiSLP03b]